MRARGHGALRFSPWPSAPPNPSLRKGEEGKDSCLEQLTFHRVRRAKKEVVVQFFFLFLLLDWEGMPESLREAKDTMGHLGYCKGQWSNWVIMASGSQDGSLLFPSLRLLVPIAMSVMLLGYSSLDQNVSSFTFLWSIKVTSPFSYFPSKLNHVW